MKVFHKNGREDDKYNIRMPRQYLQVTDDDTGDKVLGAKHMRVARMAMPSLERE